MLLDGAEAEFYDGFMRALAEERDPCRWR